MIALFLAVINLSNVDPDAVKANPVVLTKTADATGLLALNKPLAGLGDESSISVCTFGAPPLGSPLTGAGAFNDANALTRTFTQPQCAGDTAGLDSAFGPQTFGPQTFGGEFTPLETAMPWVNLRSPAPVEFVMTPVRTSSIPSVPAVHLLGITAASGSFAFHGASEYGGGIRGLHPVSGEVHPSSPVQPVSPQRR